MPTFAVSRRLGDGGGSGRHAASTSRRTLSRNPRTADAASFWTKDRIKPWRRRGTGVSGQRTFERGPVARVANSVGFLPADAHGAYTLATGTGLLLVVLALAGSAAAYRLATHPAQI